MIKSAVAVGSSGEISRGVGMKRRVGVGGHVVAVHGGDVGLSGHAMRCCSITFRPSRTLAAVGLGSRGEEDSSWLRHTLAMDKGHGCVVRSNKGLSRAAHVVRWVWIGLSHGVQLLVGRGRRRGAKASLEKFQRVGGQ